MEEQSEEKHEYWDGFIVPLSELLAMAGGTYAHSVITINIGAELREKLKGGPCRVMSSDMRVKIPRSPFYLYPDASIACGERLFDPDAPDTTTLINPKVVVEVLSPSTESYDRGKKLEKYIRIPSLEEYVLISQDEPRVDTFFRHSDGSWTFTVAAGIEASVSLRSLNIAIPLADIYTGVDFPPPKEPVTP